MTKHEDTTTADAVGSPLQQGVSRLLPERVQLSRAKGWKMPPNTVKVDRTTKWGNPFKVGAKNPYGTVTKDARHSWQIYLGFAPQNELLVAAARAELRGKNLACWCKRPGPYEDDACHAAVLLKLANSEPANDGAEPHAPR